MAPTLTADDVMAFLVSFEALAEKEDFALIRPLIDEHAVFRFNDGDFVGRAAIQAAASPCVVAVRACSRTTAGTFASCTNT